MRFIIAYFLSLMFASLFCAVLIAAYTWSLPWPSPVPNSELSFGVIFGGFWTAFLLMTPTGIPLAAACIAISRKIRLNPNVYWIAAGGISALIALAAALYPIWSFAPMDDGSDGQMSFLEEWLWWGQFALPSGMLAGFLFKKIRFGSAFDTLDT